MARLTVIQGRQLSNRGGQEVNRVCVSVTMQEMQTLPQPSELAVVKTSLLLKRPKADCLPLVFAGGIVASRLS